MYDELLEGPVRPHRYSQLHLVLSSELDGDGINTYCPLEFVLVWDTWEWWLVMSASPFTLGT